MELFVDTADVVALRDLKGLVDGVTTNPSLIARTQRDFVETLKDICTLIPGPVSAECIATDCEGMLQEGRHLATIAPNIVIKVPLTQEGLAACRTLTQEGYKVNVTLCFSLPQALLAAKCGATFVSPFVGRLDDIGADGMGLIREIRQAFDHYASFKTKILAASIRHVPHVKQAALAGADVITLPPEVLRQMITHPLTDKGLAAFLADWKQYAPKS